MTATITPLGTAALEFDTSFAAYTTCCRMDDAHVLVLWQGVSGGSVGAQIIAVDSGGVASAVGSPLAVTPTDANGGWVQLVRVDDTHVLALFRGTAAQSFGGRAQMLAINTTTWAVSNVGTGVTYGTDNSIHQAAVLIDASHALVCYAHDAVTPQGRARVIGWDGSYNLSVTWSELGLGGVLFNEPALAPIPGAPGKFALWYRSTDDDGFMRVLSVATGSDYAVTSTTPVEFDTSLGRFHSVDVLDDTHLLHVARRGATVLQAQVFRWTGSDIEALGSPLTVVSAQTAYNHVRVVGADGEAYFAAVVYRLDSDGDGYMQIVRVDKSTWAVTVESASAVEFETSEFITHSQNKSTALLWFESDGDEGEARMVVAWSGPGAPDGFIRTFEIGLELAAGAQVIEIGQVSESSTAQSLVSVKRRGVAQITEYDTPQSVGRRTITRVSQIAEANTAQAVASTHRRTLAQVVEDDLAQAVARVERKALVQAVEENAAQSVSPRLQHTVAQAVEGDLAQAIARRKRMSLGQASEADTAQTLGVFKGRVIGQAIEADTAHPVSWAPRHRLIAQLVERDTAHAIAPVRIRLIVQVTEQNAAQSLSSRKVRAIAHVAEQDLAQGITSRHIAAIAQITEHDSAAALTTVRTRSIGQLVEEDTPMPVTKSAIVGEIAQITEDDLAQAIAWAPRHRLVSQLLEADAAQAITNRKSLALSQVVEASTAAGLDRLKRANIAPVTEEHAAQGILARRIIPVVQVLETAAAQALGRRKIAGISQAIEQAAAQGVAPRRVVPITQVIEVDLAQLIDRRAYRSITQVIELDVAQDITIQIFGRRLILVAGVERFDLTPILAAIDTAPRLTAIDTRPILERVR